jgi:GGDEF domain-containing protein
LGAADVATARSVMSDEPGDGVDSRVDSRVADESGEVPADVAIRLLRALDRAPSAFVTLVDADLRSRWVSQSATWVTGTDPVSRPGRHAFEHIHPDDVERLAHGMAQLRAARPPASRRSTSGTGRPPGGDGTAGHHGREASTSVPVPEPLRYRVRRPDDTWLTVEATVHNLLDDPIVKGLLVIGRRVGGELDGVGHVVDLLTTNAPLPEVLAACANLVPHYLGSAAVVGMLDGKPVIGAPAGSTAERLAEDCRWWRPTVADGLPRTSTDFAAFPEDLAARARDEGYRSAWVLPLTEASTGDVLGCVVVWVRIEVELNIATEDGLRQASRLATLVMGEQRRQHALERAAVTDPLTGVGNRTALRRRLDAVHGPVTLAIVDLDDFKPINDTHGHDVGDEVLRTAARRIVGAVREDDVVVRFGGDEFAVVFADTGPAGASDGDDDDHGDAAGDAGTSSGLADAERRIVEAIAEPVELASGQTISIAASIGLATAAPGDVVRQADAALYEAKRRKRQSGGRGEDDSARSVL